MVRETSYKFNLLLISRINMGTMLRIILIYRERVYLSYAKPLYLL